MKYLSEENLLLRLWTLVKQDMRTRFTGDSYINVSITINIRRPNL